MIPRKMRAPQNLESHTVFVGTHEWEEGLYGKEGITMRWRRARGTEGGALPRGEGCYILKAAGGHQIKKWRFGNFLIEEVYLSLKNGKNS